MLTAFILLSFLDFGANGLGIITVVYLLLSGFLLFQTWRSHKQVLQEPVYGNAARPEQITGYRDTNPPQHTPVTKEGTFWIFVFITVAFFAAHFFIVKPDYAPRPAAPTTTQQVAQ